MKLFIVISSLTLLFGFSSSRRFILQYRNLNNYYRLYEGNWEEYFEVGNLCEELQNSPIFLHDFSGEDSYNFKTNQLFFSGSEVQYTSVLVGFNNIIVPTILCNYGSSKFYLAKHSNCEYILLFIQLETDNIPSLFAIAVEKIELQNEPEISTEEFHILLKQFNSLEKYNQWSNVNFVFQEEVKIFQLCMTLFLRTNENSANTKISLNFSEHGSNNRVRGELYIEKTRDLSMNIETRFNEHVEEVGNSLFTLRVYYAPTIVCNTKKIHFRVRRRSESTITTFFFSPHPYSNNINKIFYYYSHNGENVVLYDHNNVYSVVLRV